MSNIAIKAVFLDLDGTLHDFEAAALKAMTPVFKIVRKKYPKISEASLRTEYDKIWEVALKTPHNDGRPGLEIRAGRFRSLLTAFGIDDPELVSKMNKNYGDAFEKEVRLFGKAEMTLKKIRKRYDLYIVTDGSEWSKKVIAALGISIHFKDIFTAEAARASKHDGSLFRYAIKKSGLRQQDVIAVGDSYERDILGAEIAGIRSIWLCRSRKSPVRATKRCAMLAATIEDIGQLDEALDGIGPKEPNLRCCGNEVPKSR